MQRRLLVVAVMGLTACRFHFEAHPRDASSHDSARDASAVDSLDATGALGALDARVCTYQIAAGYAFACARTGTAIDCWGDNTMDQLGGGTTVTNDPTPQPVSGQWTAVWGGGEFACALDTTGAPWCWGSDGYGQLGDNAMGTNQASPVKVQGTFPPLVELALGHSHACGRTAAGAVYCWGSDAFQQLGQATPGNRAVPTLVSGISDAVQLTAGYEHTCIVRSDATAWCWGRNDSGELGDGTTTSRATPMPVVTAGGAALAGVTEIRGGGDHTCARVGTAVWCWGLNAEGQLGDGTTTMRDNPVQVALPIAAARLALGQATTLAIASNGAVYGWGRNSAGELDDGTQTQRTSPVPALVGVEAIAIGTQQVCGQLAGENRVECWGDNSSGQLGDGTTSFRVVPGPIAWSCN